MAFRLSNAPAVFQILMQSVLMGLNPPDGKQFVLVYIDDVLVYSWTLEEHLKHLQLIMQKIETVGLKLKPSKCNFVREEVEYLGHILTPEGLKTNPRLVEAVSKYPQPRNVKEVRQFLGLGSYYRCFIEKFAAVAQPLTMLTRKNVPFEWTNDHQQAFNTLKQCLTTAFVTPHLAAPLYWKLMPAYRALVLFSFKFKLIGNVIQWHMPADHLVWLNKITDLETLAVVWAITHFHSYFYGHLVTVYKDHSAVQVILNTTTPQGTGSMRGGGLECIDQESGK